MQTTLYLVRHGVTRANKENRFAGRSDEGLHADGIAQITALGERLAGLGVNRIVAGPLPRTRQSAELLATALGVGVEIEAGFNEIDIAHWDCLTKDEIRQQHGEQYPTWLATPHLFAVTGCESIADVQARAAAAVEKLLAAHAGETILVVSHLIVLRSLVLYFQKRPIEEFRAVKIDNGSLLRVLCSRTGADSLEWL